MSWPHGIGEEEALNKLATESLADFRDLRLLPPMIIYETGAISILGGEGGNQLAQVTRHAFRASDNPAQLLVDVARAVAPKWVR